MQFLSKSLASFLSSFFFTIFNVHSPLFQQSLRSLGAGKTLSPKVLQLSKDLFTKCYQEYQGATRHSICVQFIKKIIYIHSISKNYLLLWLWFEDMVGLSQQNYLWPFLHFIGMSHSTGVNPYTKRAKCIQ